MFFKNVSLHVSAQVLNAVGSFVQKSLGSDAQFPSVSKMFSEEKNTKKKRN